MKATFKFQPHRGVWQHDGTGAAITHWQADDDMAQVMESARKAVVSAANKNLGLKLTDADVTVQFDDKSFKAAPEPIPQPVPAR